MTKKKLSLIGGALALIALLSLFALRKGERPLTEEERMHLALDPTFLERYEGSEEKDPLLLGASKLLQGCSEEELLQALGGAHGEQSLHLLALHAFLSGNEEHFFHYMSSLSKPSELLKGFALYAKKEWSRASRLLGQTLSFEEPTFLAAVENHLAPSFLRKILLAHALVESGSYLEARELLETQVELEEKHMVNGARLVLGLSYAKEALEKGAKNDEALFKALLYFEKAELSGFKEIAESAGRALLSSILHSGSSLAYKSQAIRLLAGWQRNDLLAFIADRLASDLSISTSVDSPLPSEFQALLFDRRTKLLKQAIEGGESLTFTRYLENFPDLWSASIQKSMEARALRLCFSDLVGLERSLSLLKKYGDSTALLTRLVEKGMLIWQGEGKERHGTELFEIALKYADEQEKKLLTKEIQSFFQGLFEEAEDAYLVKRLALVHESASHLNIPLVSSFTKEKLANTLADADHFFLTHNFTSAKNHAAWVLCCDPNNQEALYLVGLSAFSLGEYKLALRSLKRLEEKDERTLQALYLCQMEGKYDSLAQGDEEECEAWDVSSLPLMR